MSIKITKKKNINKEQNAKIIRIHLTRLPKKKTKCWLTDDGNDCGKRKKVIETLANDVEKIFDLQIPRD